MVDEVLSCMGLVPSFAARAKGGQEAEVHGDTALYRQSGPGNSVVGHGCSTRMWWRGRSCTRRCHVHGTQLLPSAGVGWEGTFVNWNGEERVEGEEISSGGGRGVPPVQTAPISLK